ncbi:MAG: hydrogenase [Deltaproteobacteria bacterium]|nr:hydrogenase [Deltaproteobacteria bacterium]
MLSVLLTLSGLGLMALSGGPASWLPLKASTGQRLTVGLFLGGSLLGLVGTVLSLLDPGAATLLLPWGFPWGRFAVVIDPLSAFFLWLIFTVPALGSVYSLSYWRAAEHPDNSQRLGFFYGLLAASMGMVVIARDSILFLIVWEIMALSAYFAAAVEDDRPEVRQAGWIYLVATHIGTLILIAMFALWYRETASFALLTPVAVPLSRAGIIFVLAVLGFGFKAGLMPLHLWLPGAHANAPSHVSAVMSGVMLKMGLYGIIRVSGLLLQLESWWGWLLLVVGSISGLYAIALALSQRDLKRALAYSSIENVGIMAMGIGLALLGRASNRPELVLLGLGGALFHILNHGLFKSLLFFNAGAIIHAGRTRDLEQMGGLGKNMPVTAGLFLVGAVAICALPPLNGFASEWLIYLGLFKTLAAASPANLALAGGAAVVLAMIGALALATFVKLYGTIFLGSSRAPAAPPAHDPEASMKIPMFCLAFASIFLGLLPSLIAPLLEKAVRLWAPLLASGLTLAALVPQLWLTYVGSGIIIIIAGWACWQKILRQGKAVSRGVTWDCGYAKPTAKMQYTGTSLSQPLVRLFSFALRPGTLKNLTNLPFPGKSEMQNFVPDAVLERLVLPVFQRCSRFIPKVYIFQHGQTHLYVLYVLLICIALFVFSGIGGGL